MDVDYAYSRQADDMAALGNGIKAFEKDMKKVMLLMTELGTSLESVSRSFDALTSLSFTSEEVKRRVHHFSESVVEMKQGAPFQNYNRLVHEEVLQPVQELKKSLKNAQSAQASREKAHKKRRTARDKVDKTESAYAAKGKSLADCAKYPGLKVKRDHANEVFDETDSAFQESFKSLIHRVEEVTSRSMKRYLDLNAGYMSSVIDSLVKTDPTVNEAVDLYRRQLQQERQSEIARQRTQLADEISRLSAAPSLDVSPVQPLRSNGANNSTGSPPLSSSRRQRPTAKQSDSSSRPATLTKRLARPSNDGPTSSGPATALDDAAKPKSNDDAAAVAAATAHIDPQPASTAGNVDQRAVSSPLTEDSLQPMRPAPAKPATMFDAHSTDGSDAPSTVVPASGYFSAQKREIANEFRNALGS